MGIALCTIHPTPPVLGLTASQSQEVAAQSPHAASPLHPIAPTGNVRGPHGARVPIEGASPLAILRPPQVHGLVLRQQEGKRLRIETIMLPSGF